MRRSRERDRRGRRETSQKVVEAADRGELTERTDCRSLMVGVGEESTDVLENEGQN